MIVVALGGRCAEKVFFGDFTTGAYDDLQKVYRIAYNAVVKLGFSEEVGYIGYEDNQYVNKLSEETQKLIDYEVDQFIRQAEEIAMKLVEENKHHIRNLADNLLEKETLDLNSIISILGERPFAPNPTFKAYLETKQTIDNQIDQDQNNDQNGQNGQNDEN